MSDTITISRAEYDGLQATIESLSSQLAYLKRMIFGQKSERHIPVDDAQQELDLGVGSKEPVRQTETITYDRQKQPKSTPHGRSALPSHLPRKTIQIEPDMDTTGLVHIRDEVTEELEYNPASFFVVEYIRPIYAPAEGFGQMVMGALPFRPIEKGRPGPGLLAHVLTAKYVDHLPLYRQAQQYRRLGVHIPDSTLEGWIPPSVTLLEPLYDLVVERVRASGYVQADETPLRVLKTGAKKGKAHQGYLFPYHAPRAKLVAFDYQSSRSRDGPNAFLTQFKGYLQTDGYAGYNELAARSDIVHAGCMAHARRGFEKALDNDKARAEYALELFRDLFAIEREAKESDMGDARRLELRCGQAVPTLDTLHKWCEATLREVLPQSAIGKAIAYTLNHWVPLTEYTRHEVLEISNNAVENLIRPVAVGRKNWLFAGSPNGARRAAIIYSLVGCCRLNHVEPYAWLRDVISRINDHPANKLEELLPSAWKAPVEDRTYVNT